MPKPRQDRPVVAVAVTVEPGKSNMPAYQKRWREGRRGPLARETRNGVPEFRPYVYQGTGVDIYLGQYGGELDEPAE